MTHDGIAVTRRSFLEIAGATGLTAALAGALAGCGGDSGELTFWNYFASQNERDGMAKVLKRFKATDAGLSVSPEGIPLADYMPKVIAAVQANRLAPTGQILVGTLPDMVELDAVRDITDRVDGWDGKTKVHDRLWEEVTQDGKIYGVPSFTFVGWLYCRADWLEEAGLSAPKDWDEFEQAAIALTDADKGRYGFGMRGGVGGGTDLMNYLESYGVTFVDDQGQPALEKDPLAEGLDFFSGLHLRHHAVPPSVASDSFQQLMTSFNTGVTGMLGHHTGSLIEVTDALEPETQVITAALPTGPGGSASRYFGQHNAIFTDDDDEADDAWEWIAHWGSDMESQIDFMLSCGQFPTLLEAADSPEIANNKMYAAAVEVLDTAPRATVFGGMNAFQANHLLPAFQQLLTGEATVDQAADAVIDGLEQETT